MQNNSINSFERKNYLSISEFESFYEAKNSNPLIIVDIACNIVFSNEAFKIVFNITEGQKFFDLESEPNLGYLLFALTGSNYDNFQFDVTFSPEHNLRNNEYNVELERIYISEREYFVLIFNSLAEKEKLEERINNLHNALEYGNVPVIITDGKGLITYSTNSFERILKTQLENIYFNYLPEVLSFFLDHGDIRILEESISNFNVWQKTIVLNDDNDLRYYELKLNPIYREGSEYNKFIVTANDITNYVKKNQIVKKSENRLKSIINNISDLFLIIKEKDEKFVLENANENFFRVFGLNKNNVLKNNIELVLDEKLLNAIIPQIEKIKDLETSGIEFKYDGFRSKHYNIKIASIEDKIEKEILYIISMQDITDELLYQRQLRAMYEKENHLNKLKNAFLENMSHEIRTPFNAIIGYSEIIDDSVEMEDYGTLSELAGSLKDVLKRVLNLFNNIVEVFQIEAGEVELDKVNLNCNQVLRSVYNKRYDEAVLKNLDFKIDLRDEWINIETDWVKFERIIDSLIENSIKYTSQGNILVTSAIVDDSAQITISDTGSGIDETEINRMLEPFAQEEEGYTRSYEGAGLGLTIAYKLTQLLQGKFHIQSTKNKGTEITLIFPLIRTEAEYS